uniref:Copia protein n=1 Tax=Tanacetum cinerariifolium TaxID=118510 RepID=A0A699HCC8_TANCI|nr:copia protein [Tanacetum cinerariifolium]
MKHAKPETPDSSNKSVSRTISVSETKSCLLKEYLIKFSVMNGKKPLTLDFKTFTTSTSLDYNNGAYVAHYSTELINYSLIIGTKVDIREIIYSDLVTKLLNKSRMKYVSYPRFISYALEELMGLEYTQDEQFGYLPSTLSNFNFSKDTYKVTEIELKAYIIAVNNQKDLVSPLSLSSKKKKRKSQTLTLILPKSQALRLSEHSLRRENNLSPKRHLVRPRGNDHPTDRDLTFTDYDEGAAKTTPFPKGLRKISSKVKPDIEALRIKTFADVQALLLFYDEMVYEFADKNGPKTQVLELMKQTALAISTSEAEYVSARKACQQPLWMKQAFIDYDIRLDDIPIMCDNKGAIDLSKNLVQHSRTKHIEIRHHFLRDNIQKENFSIEKVPSKENIADILTKPLKRELFNYLHLGLGMMEQID